MYLSGQGQGPVSAPCEHGHSVVSLSFRDKRGEEFFFFASLVTISF